MTTTRITPDIQKRIDKSVNYILKDLQGDLTLSRLASVANYSPFHYQRLFRQVMGESPKQYVLRMRLETAAHFLVIHKNKPVQVIAGECGFSSPAVFARAFKKSFGITAEEFRAVPRLRQDGVHKRANHLRKLLHSNTNTAPEKKPAEKIAVKVLPTLTGICMNSEFDSTEKANNAVKELLVAAIAHDLVTSSTKIIGIMYPHHNIYRAFLTIDDNVAIPATFNKAEINAGKYATFKITGDIHDVFEQLMHFYQQWLPQNGYKLAGIYGFEVFAQSPVNRAYASIEREIHVPIEPV